MVTTRNQMFAIIIKTVKTVKTLGRFCWQNKQTKSYRTPTIVFKCGNFFLMMIAMTFIVIEQIYFFSGKKSKKVTENHTGLVEQEVGWRWRQIRILIGWQSSRDGGRESL